VYWIQAIRGFIILIAMLIEAQKVRYSRALADPGEQKNR
jgi:hypothetical protein